MHYLSRSPNELMSSCYLNMMNACDQVVSNDLDSRMSVLPTYGFSSKQMACYRYLLNSPLSGKSRDVIWHGFSKVNPWNEPNLT